MAKKNNEEERIWEKSIKQEEIEYEMSMWKEIDEKWMKRDEIQ